MRKTHLLTTLIILLLSLATHAQFADIRGKVMMEEDIAYTAYVKLTKGDAVIGKNPVSTTGEFIFSELTPGTYTLEAIVSGTDSFVETFYLQSGESAYKKILLAKGVSQLREANIINVRIREEPIVTTGGIIIASPFEGITGIVAVNTGVTVRGGVIQGNSSRVGQLAILNNGLSQIGPLTPTTFNLGQVKVLTSGISAMYGDFLGGAIEYSTSDVLDTTKLSQYMLRSSSPFNSYHQNAFEAMWYRPLIVRDGKTKLAITQSFYADFKKDPDPASVALYKLNAEAKNNLLSTPFSTSDNGLELPAPNRYTSADFESTKAKTNSSSYSLYATTKMAYKPGDDMVLRLEPTLQYSKQHQYSFSNSLLNYDHNPLSSTVVAKLNAQVLHTLVKPFSSKGVQLYDSGLISKLSYMLIADYQRVNSSTKDPLHGDDIFGYGHIGTFSRAGQDAYQYMEDAKTVTDQYGNQVTVQGYHNYTGFTDTSLSFTVDAKNGQRAAVTQYVMDNNAIRTLSELSQAQGLLNGQNPVTINGMWYAPGTVVSRYSKSDEQKASFNAIVNMSINPKRKIGEQHDLQLGTLFEQRRRSYYSLDANRLWQIMPQLVNRQYGIADINNPILSYDENGIFTDSIQYNLTEDLSRQSYFDKSLRAKVDETNGWHTGSAHFIDVNSIDPSQLSLDMFTADELWNNGSSYLNYAGYDYKGNLLRKSTSISDFTNDQTNRYVDAYRPNYSAVWLQDKFVLEKIKIRAGVRVERFDANQSVLKDEYSLYPIRTTSEVSSVANQAVVHPSTLPADAAVYVNDMNNPTNIVGYRSGHTWFDERGNEVSSPEYIRQKTTNGVIQPMLVDPTNQHLSAASFQDYNPQILVLPRLSFSFPINSKALFYAYYDKFAQRPSFGQSFAPISSYYFLENANTSVLANPGLKPARRTDYKFGYKQVIGLRGQLDLTAGYAEIKDDINLISVNQAYPRSYTTYSNIDFSTVKSFGAEYSVGTKHMGINVAYLLQFADGTGSNANSAATLIQLNQPNLRSMYPLDYDIRHKLNGSVTYTIDSTRGGKHGLWKNMSFALYAKSQSGSPYTALLTAVPEAQELGTASRSQIKGNPFGSRMPWNYSLDLSISKLAMVRGKAFTVQLNALNLLNISNIYNVYAYSSSATDDGYLASPAGQQQVRNELNAQSFVNYYNLKQNNPNNFGNPRMLSLTIRTSF